MNHMRAVVAVGGILLCAGGARQMPAGNAAGDRAALGALYEATNGPVWRMNTNWMTAAPLAQWYGVTTGTGGRVTRLDLRRNNLAGALPAELGRLTQLEQLYLQHNRLTGNLPSEMANLTLLEELNLADNGLRGALPSSVSSMPVTLSPSWWLDDTLCYENRTDLTTGGYVGNPRGLPPRSCATGLRQALTALWTATGGANWTDGTNWLTSAHLEDWAGVHIAWPETFVGGLYLADNGLTGSLPNDEALWRTILGESRDTYLYLNGNNLTGPFPYALAQLLAERSSFRGGNAWLDISETDLCIPDPGDPVFRTGRWPQWIRSSGAPAC